MAFAFVNCDVYTGDEVLFDQAILVEGDKIAGLTSIHSVPASYEVIDLGGESVAPGFIDIQVNGGGGVLFNDDTSVEGIRTIAEAHAAFGTLSFLPTLITAGPQKMTEATEAVRSAQAQGLHSVLGLHLEGPYIDADKAGVHDKSFVRSLTDEELRSVLLPNKDVLRLLTISPSKVESRHLEDIVDAGITVCLGHTGASYEEAVIAFDRGVAGVTHLFNAMSQIAAREPGTVGASLATRDTWAGIIADGHHVHLGAVAAARNAKRDKLMLVTDAMPPVGKPGLSYVLGPYEIKCVDGKCTTADGTLAGSALDMATAVRNCVQRCGIPKDETFRMASTYPAQFLGVDGHLGRIAPGMTADFVILNGQMHVEAVVQRGVFRPN